MSLPIPHATHLAMLKAVGADAVSADAGEFYGVFKPHYQAALSDPAIEGTAPVLICRTYDIERLTIRKGQNLTICGEVYRVVRHEPDGEGESIVILKAP